LCFTRPSNQLPAPPSPDVAAARALTPGIAAALLLDLGDGAWPLCNTFRQIAVIAMIELADSFMLVTN
jgi:hypothetical protein